MATLKEFEDILRQSGMTNALALLDDLRKRDRATRSAAPARRIAGRKMTAELARSILELHATTGMTQQEIAFKLGVNQGRVNEVIKRGKWLSADPHAPEAVSRDRALERLQQRAKARRARPPATPSPAATPSLVLSGSRPRPAPVPVPAVAPPAQLPLNRPGAPGRESAPVDTRPSRPAEDRAPLPRLPMAPGPIVSAQLAFLDL